MNSNERVVKEMLEARGFRVLRNGWPDFLCLRQTERYKHKDYRDNPVFEKVTGIMAVEVKSKSDSLSDEQKEVHKALMAVRIPVFVVRPNEEKTFRVRNFLTHAEIAHLNELVAANVAHVDALQKRILELQAECIRLNQIIQASSVVLSEASSLLEHSPADETEVAIDHNVTYSFPESA